MKEQQCLNLMRSRKFQLRVISIVEESAACHFQSAIASDEDIKNLHDWKSAIEEQPRQQTSALSVKFAYDYEFAIIRACKEFSLPVMKKEEGDAPGHDFRLATSDKGVVPFEVKTTQSTGGFTGSTHSEAKGKAENYVLISYELDLGKPIPKGTFEFYGVVKSAHFAVLTGTEVSWAGAATDSNSSTTGKIPVEKFEEYMDSVTLGAVSPCKKWCKIIREDLLPYRSSNTLQLEEAN